MEKRNGRVIKEHVKGTHVQSQQQAGLRVGGAGGNGVRKMETTVLEQ